MNQQQLNQEQIAFMLRDLEQRSLTKRSELEALADIVGFVPLLVAAVYKVLGPEEAQAFGPNMTMEKACAALVKYFTAHANDALQDKKTFDAQVTGLKRQLTGVVGARVLPGGGGKVSPFGPGTSG